MPSTAAGSPTNPTGTARPARPGRAVRRGRWMAALGTVLLLAGLSILGWAAWQFFGTNIVSHREASQQVSKLEQAWRQKAPAASGRGGSATTAPGADWTTTGDGVAVMRIPALGADWQYPVLVGTTPEVLAQGIGWYVGTARAGQVGNFAVAAHRVTHGEPFRHLLELHKGDQVIVETRDEVYTYVLDASPSQLTVDDVEGGWVLDPVPGKPVTTRPTQRLITLTTCADLFHSPRRSVAFGHLVSQHSR